MNKRIISKIVIICLIIIFFYLSLTGCFLFLIPKDSLSKQNKDSQDTSIQKNQNDSHSEIITKYEPIDISKLKEIDEYAKMVPSSFEKDIETLAKYLVKTSKNELEKARAIWIWITNNISYDVDGYFSGSISTYDAQTAFNKRLGVCSGYASLFKQMADIVNLKSEVITGYAKGYSYNPSIKELPNSNHAWIAINIQNKWYLCDPTWGSGYVDYKRKFIKDYEEFYFCANPAQLIYTHFPSDIKWQLLENPLDSSTFLNLLHVWPLFFKLDLKPVSHPFARIETNTNSLNIIFSTSYDNIRILAAIYYKDTRKEAVKPTYNKLKEGNFYKWSININFPLKGEYYIYIFGGKESNTTFSAVAQYFVEITQ